MERYDGIRTLLQRSSLYQVAYEALDSQLKEKNLAPGTVLLEGPIADGLGMSRIPVREALKRLAEENRIHRFNGRGYLVGSAEGEVTPMRINLRLIDWPANLPSDGAALRKPAWESIRDDVATTIASFIPFGCYRVMEAELAKAYGVSRTVSRTALYRLQESGVVEKDSRSRWLAGPFTAQANAEQYELRRLLEVAAFRSAAAGLDRRTLQEMDRRLARAQERNGDVDAEEIAVLEGDLHKACLRPIKNRILAASLARCRHSFVVNKLFHFHVGAADHGPMLHEHRTVFSALLCGDIDVACAALERHLRMAEDRTLRRLKVLSIVPEPPLPPYLLRLH